MLHCVSLSYNCNNIESDLKVRMRYLLDIYQNLMQAARNIALCNVIFTLGFRLGDTSAGSTFSAES